MYKQILGPDGLPIRSGYAEAGASLQKRALKGFKPSSIDAIHDIDANNAVLRQRSRMLYMAAPIATSAIRTNRTNVIGPGLRLKPKVDREVLGMSKEKASEFQKQIEKEFSLWAEDKAACDATGVNDFYSLQQLALAGWLINGDSFGIFKYKDPEPMRPYSLRLHIIESDRVSTKPEAGAIATPYMLIDGNRLYPSIYSTEGTHNGNEVHDGVEVDAGGDVIAYHVCSGYPGINRIGEQVTWERIEAYGEETGLPNIIHVMESERAEQYRGVPYLAHVIEPLLQIRRYTESELMASLVESFFTAFIKTNSDTSQMPANETGEKISSDPNDFEMGPGEINVLQPNEDITFGDPKRPASGFDNFVNAMAKQIGAALDIPVDILLKEFNSSYSASRAALMEAWKVFKMRRGWFVSDFCEPVYERWFAEAVARGRIDAPGFFDDPLIRKAYLGSQWIGPSQGQLDPVKEITAEKMAIEMGITTRAKATTRINGSDFEDNVEQLEEENKKMLDAGINPESGTQVTIIEEENNGETNKRSAPQDGG